MLGQDKICCADIFKAIFVLQVPKSKARSCVAVHRAKKAERRSSQGCLDRETRIRFDACVQQATLLKTHARHVQVNTARMDTCVF